MKHFDLKIQKQHLLSCTFAILFTCTLFAQSITRTQIHYNGIPFTTYTFTTTSANIQSNVNCPSAGGNVNTPSWVTVGPHTVGMPYCWGGFSSLSSFTSSLLNGKAAGDNDCTTNGDCCESCALGVDCSGFVSHAWGLSTKYSTTTLPNISTAYSSASQVKQGDIFNLAGSHTRLVDTNYANGSFLLMESSAVDWKVSYRSYTTSQLTSYTPRWYVNVDTGALVCTNKYASLPYSTSFENVWAFDSCNNGAQRIPDKYWKSNIGTGGSGNDYWHRDDYAGGDWTSLASGQYTPSASSGSYSARFRNDMSTGGTTGMLDLHVDLSATGNKTIQFDYMHAESSPSPFSFNVMLSTDGGSTFSTTLSTITTASITAWTTYSITTNATSATSVLRFMVDDKGLKDVGIDNLSVSLAGTSGILAVNNNALLELYPNPSDGTILNGVLPNCETKTIAVTIFDMVGKVVLTKTVLMDRDNFVLNFDENKLSTGVYLFVATAGTKQFRKKIVVN